MPSIPALLDVERFEQFAVLDLAAITLGFACSNADSEVIGCQVLIYGRAVFSFWLTHVDLDVLDFDLCRDLACFFCPSCYLI